MSNVLRLGDRVRVTREWRPGVAGLPVEGEIVAFPDGARVQVQTRGGAKILAEFRQVSRVDDDAPRSLWGGDAA